MNRIFLSLAILVLAIEARGDEIPVKLESGKAAYHVLHFPAKHKASLSVSFDADIGVYDAAGKIISRSGPKDAKLDFTTKDKADCLVKIVNPGPAPRSGIFRHNLQAFDNAPPTRLEIPANKKAAFFRVAEPGKITLLEIESDAPPFEVAVYNVLGAKIAKDAKGRAVAYDGQENQIVRVSVANVDKKDIACKFKWSAHAVEKTALPAFDLEHDAKKEFKLSFAADKLAAIWVTSEKDTDVDLMVYDAKGKEVVSDISIGKDCFVGWVPASAATYRVVVVNHGKGANRCVLRQLK
jgi:hypothetical protein